jgi:hypothetical protein
MDAELLVHWMAHRGEGHWDSFRSAVESVYADHGKQPRPTALSDVLSTLAVADFFVHDTPRWRVLRPTLGGVSVGRALLLGGRTPTLIDGLSQACRRQGIDLIDEVLHWGIRRYTLVGSSNEQVFRVAGHLNLTFLPEVADGLARWTTPISDIVASAPTAEPPHNWGIHSYDLGQHEWVERDLPGTARKFSPSRGLPIYLIAGPDGTQRQMNSRLSVYAAAYFRSIPLLQYNAATSTLSTPLGAHPPANLARIAALSAGNLPRREGRRLVFDGLRPRVARVLLGLTGCPLPIRNALRLGESQ